MSNEIKGMLFTVGAVVLGVLVANMVQKKLMERSADDSME